MAMTKAKTKQLTHQQPGTGSVVRTVYDKLTEVVSVKDFGAVGDGVTNDSIAISNAIATAKKVFFPAGTYKCNVTISNKVVLEGEGSTSTIIKPFSNTTAALTYSFAAMGSPIYSYWNYHSEVHNIGFQSNTALTGVGFTFGKTDPTLYATNDEYANNVKFYGCRFSGFDKGVQFPFGNIGTEFYSCGFDSNKYGVYTLNNKFGGMMHAGNKYFYGGEFHGNTVAVYIHNTADGFGGISFYGTVLESNSIAVYAYMSAMQVTPITFDSVWFEANGSLIGGNSTIDSWSGSTKSSQTLTNKSIIVDGGSGKLAINSSFAADIRLIGNDHQVVCTNCRVETSGGYNGGLLVVDSPTTSFIKFINPYWDAGPSSSSSYYIPFVSGNVVQNSKTIINGTPAASRVFQVPARSSKVTSYGPSRIMGSPLTSAATTGNGSFNLTGTVVADGRLYSNCNEFTQASFGSGQYTALATPFYSTTTTAGWYVATFDIKVTVGSIYLHIWDRNTAQFIINVGCDTSVGWRTLAGVAYSAGGQTLYWDFQGNGVNATWRVSAFQLHKFTTQQEAFDFIASGVFAES